MAKDFYETLGVDRTATADEIKSAYRQLAKKYHPDLNRDDTDGAAQKFKEINEAYQVLSDPKKKEMYDTYGATGPQAGGTTWGGGQTYDPFGGSMDIESILEQLFGNRGFAEHGFGGTNRGPSRGPTQGTSIRIQLSITFEEAAFGTKKEIKYKRLAECDQCKGTGQKPGTGSHTCARCGGRGVVTGQQRSIFGTVSTAEACPDCDGKGTIPDEPCAACKGSGMVRQQTRVTISIPAGIDTGQILTLRGDGNASPDGGPPGDLLVVVTVKPDKLFQRVGYDLLLDLEINMVLAALGGEIEIPTLDGKVRYEIPEGTQPGTRFRLKGKGIRHEGSRGAGDLYVRVDVAVPKRLNARQKKLLSQFADKTKLQKPEFSKPADRY